MSTQALQAIVETVLASGYLFPEQHQEINQRFLSVAVSPEEFQLMEHLDRALLNGEVNYVSSFQRNVA